MKKIIDWTLIQAAIDSGMSYREVDKKYSVTQRSIANAKKRGIINTRNRSEATKLAFKKFGPKKLSPEARENLSKRMSENNPGGRSKWYEVEGIKVQGKWEKAFIEFCIQKNIKCNRGKRIAYLMEGKVRSYTPDFYLPDLNLYVEIKGRWWGNDRQKMIHVLDQHKEKKFIIIQDLDFAKYLPTKLT
jgi:hypothetical protein